MKKRQLAVILALIISLMMITFGALIICRGAVKDGESEINRHVSIECGPEGDVQYQEEITQIFERHGATVHMRADLWKSVFTVTGSTQKDFDAAMVEIRALLSKTKCALTTN